MDSNISSSTIETNEPASPPLESAKAKKRKIGEPSKTFKQRMLSLERGELGFWRPYNPEIFQMRVVELVFHELRHCMSCTLKHVLYIAFYEQGLLRNSEVEANVTRYVLIIVDVCMTALYARYPTPSSYRKDIELPLPFALTIQEIGVFGIAVSEIGMHVSWFEFVHYWIMLWRLPIMLVFIWKCESEALLPVYINTSRLVIMLVWGNGLVKNL